MEKDITILTVNWHSADLLQDLIHNLIEKANKPENLKYLIIDNNNGKDQKLKNIKLTGITGDIIRHDPGDLKNLSAHASGLNYGFTKVKTEFILIIDPDTYIFKEAWDDFLIGEITENQFDAIGASYPSWWLGTYHNFPSPVFCFAKTASLRKVNANWMPESCNMLKKMRNFVVRQILRCAFFFNRRNLLKYKPLRSLTRKLEDLFPICSIDTGYYLSMQEKKGNLKSGTFDAMYEEDLVLHSSIISAYSELASQYELYSYKSDIILTHQYGSQNFLLKTTKGANRENWRSLISKL